MIQNENSPGSALFGSTDGTGRAGDFQVNNKGSIESALFAASNGAAGSNAAFFQMSGRGNGLTVSHLGNSGRMASFQSNGEEVIRFGRDGSGHFTGGLIANSENNTLPAVSDCTQGMGGLVVSKLLVTVLGRQSLVEHQARDGLVTFRL